jgi:hypothetical protein
MDKHNKDQKRNNPAHSQSSDKQKKDQVKKNTPDRTKANKG